MFLKLLILLVILYNHNFVYSVQNKADIQKIYISRYTKEIPYNEEFCKSNKKIWAAHCEVAFEHLRKYEKNSFYRNVYVDYELFIDAEAFNKCYSTNISFINVKGKKYFYRHQPVAPCYGHDAVWRRYVNFRNYQKTYRLLRNTIGIYIEGSSMIIFKYINGFKEATLLDLLDVYKQPKPEEIPDNLFQLPLPHSGKITMTVIHILYKEANSLQNNIVNISDADMLSKICILMLDTSPFSNFQINVELYKTNHDVPRLRTNENICFTDPSSYYTKNQEKKVIIEGEQNKRRVIEHEADNGGNSQNEDHSHSRSEEQNNIPDVWSMNVHHCQGFIIENTKKGPNEVYAITQGIDDNSVVLLQNVFLNSEGQCYKPVEIIYNLFKEFVQKLTPRYYKI